MLNRKLLRRFNALLRLYGKPADYPTLWKEFIFQLRQFVTWDNLDEILSRLPPHLVEPVRENITTCKPLKGVGYWRSLPPYQDDKTARFPDPMLLVSPEWCIGEREQIAGYLEAGWTFTQWRGVSYCRFQCGMSEADMGSRCLTDGEWVWPEGLPHYLKCHSVRLPEEFIASMRRNGWKVPSGDETACGETHGTPDCTFWIAWGSTAWQDDSKSPSP
jgi:hypothetical protein